MTKNKYIIEEIPITTEFLREKRLIEERGELALLADGEETRHITYFSLNPGKMFFRGGHYHKSKIEKFYVISGNVKILIKDVETEENDVLEVSAGNRITIFPLCAHKFFAITPVQIIEYYSTPYDQGDDIKYNDFIGEPTC
jgi:dTDP-4-dehydrorhamnose 3,5-epimerase-like enzyme